MRMFFVVLRKSWILICVAGIAILMVGVVLFNSNSSNPSLVVSILGLLIIVGGYLASLIRIRRR